MSTTDPPSATTGVGRSSWEREATARTGAGTIFDPFETFRALRDEGPVHATSIAALFDAPDPLEKFFGDRPHFCTMDYASATAVLGDPARFTNSGLRAMSTQTYGPVSFQASDGAEHRTYRRLAQPAFSKHGMSLWSEWLGPRLDALIDGFYDQGAANLYFSYCAQFPAYITAKAFGIPDADLEIFNRWAAMLQTGAADADEAARVSGAAADYLLSIIAERRRAPKDDLISLMLTRQVEENGVVAKPTDEQVLGLSLNIMPAGVGTTYRTLGIALTALLARPALLARLYEDRTLVKAAVDETLRWNPPVLWMMRVAAADTELGGQKIPAGAIVEGCIGAANRDPAIFEDPDDFRLDRTGKGHLSFSVGPHYCIGAQVGRMELETSLNRLLDRLPGLRADPDEETPRVTGLLFRMPTAVPARWG